MSLYFDNHGNLFPYQRNRLNISDCAGLFVRNFPNSQTRKGLFDNLSMYRFDIFRELNQFFTQWINGSFATQKLNPNDIDVANLITYSDTLDSTIEIILPFFTVGGSLETYQIDAHLIPKKTILDMKTPNFVSLTLSSGLAMTVMIILKVL